jgi:hypothetical protein
MPEPSLQTFYASLESDEVLERADAIRALIASRSSRA